MNDETKGCAAMPSTSTAHPLADEHGAWGHFAETVLQSSTASEVDDLLAEALVVFDLMLKGCREQKFGDYENGDGETIGPRMDALHARLRAFATDTSTAAPAGAAKGGNTRPSGGEVDVEAECKAAITAYESFEGTGGFAKFLKGRLAARRTQAEGAKEAPTWTVEQEAQIRLEVERLRAADTFEARVRQLQALIERGHKFDWPYTDAFDDGGVAYHEAKRRIAATKSAKSAGDSNA